MKVGNVENSQNHSAGTQHQPLKISQAIAFFWMSAMVAWAIPAHGGADVSVKDRPSQPSFEVDRNFNLISKSDRNPKWSAPSKEEQRRLAQRAWQALQRDLRGDALPASQTFHESDRTFDAEGAVFRYQQLIQGVPVFGGEAKVLISTITNGNGGEPEVIRAGPQKMGLEIKLNAPAKLKPNSSQVWWPSSTGEPTLELAVIKRVSGHQEIRSANDGSLLARWPVINHLSSDQARPGAMEFDCANQKAPPSSDGEIHHYLFSAATAQAKRLNAFTGAPMNFNFNAYAYLESPIDDDPSSSRTRNFMQKYSTYLETHFQRKSYDGSASPMIAVVHAGRRYAGSGWVEPCGFAFFGDGDGAEILDTTRSYDSIAHEYSHGVIGASSKLINIAQSGALNEAFADVFAKLSSQAKEWSFAPEILGPELARKQKTLRQLDDPTRSGGPDRFVNQMMSKCDEQNDFCGVHLNSSIPALALVRFTDAVGAALAEKVIYEIFTKRLSALSDFTEFRKQWLKACQFRGCERDAKSALESVGI